MAHIRCSLVISAQPKVVFDYMCNPQNLNEMLKPSIDVEVSEKIESLIRGQELHIKMTRMGFWQEVDFIVDDFQMGSRMTYRQSRGLLKSWIHTQKFENHADDKCLVTDFVSYTVPFSVFGYLADDLFLRRDFENILNSRLIAVRSHFHNQS